ncbi:MAG: alpha/beta hydrolase [Candidatus Nanoarchaeia archaeon]|nr:alpha/beta hydrolase [Candidatus Nanoarchaeia archaeon]MDD5239308.1 alpha/beta hydrolase [Candidatus Nanoarchaeia archaeon]
MKVVIIHGAYGNPEENWFPWLRLELQKLGHDVVVPRLPTPEGQNLKNWMNIIKRYQIDDNTILIGHSIGAALILRILEKTRAKAAYLIAGFIGALGNEEVDSINSTFFEKPFEWYEIKNNCKKIAMFSSDNDPYVPAKKRDELAEKLGIKPIIVKGAGHFNVKAGYTKFELLLKELLHND